MSDVPAERVLVVPTELFHRLGYFQGFCGDVDRYLGDLFDARHASYLPRREVEQDPSFKQLIPYVIFRHTDPQVVRAYFNTRGARAWAKGGCTRSGAWASAGIFRLCDADAGPSIHPYEEGMRRELDEEVQIDTPYSARCVGLINDDQTEVGRVHLGVVHLFDVERPAVRPRETDLLETGFRPVAGNAGRSGQVSRRGRRFV